MKKINKICLKCIQDCKQTDKLKIIKCPKYRKKPVRGETTMPEFDGFTPSNFKDLKKEVSGYG